MNNKDNIVILIPSYQPDDKLIDLVEELLQMEFKNILIVNDGSSSKNNFYFEKLRQYKNVDIITHAVNQGKGRALKNGFNKILNDYENIIGCVTVDADGQHLPKDIEICAAKLIENPDDLILGVRDFDNSNVPARSMVGNKLTRNILSLLVGIKVKDTQTGLRALSVGNMKEFMKTLGEKYEFEMNMLIDTKEADINIQQVTISTVYIEENKTSHFNPILDSVRIYKVFFRYILSSLLSSIVDILLFAALVGLLNEEMPNNYILISTVFARVVSVLFNYKMNSERVFNSKNSKAGSFKRYICLAIIQMLTSALLVTIFSRTFITNETLIKVIVDIGLFFISFVIQREFVFARKEKGL